MRLASSASSSRRCYRQGNANPGAAAEPAFDVDIAVVSQHDVPHDAHAQANALHSSIRGIGTIETIVDMCKLLFVHADPLVGNAELVPVVKHTQADLYGTAVRRILDGSC